MGLFGSARANLRDVHRFGVGVLRRHLGSGRTFAIRVRDFGPIHMRKDSLDLDLARAVLVDGAYDYPWPKVAEERLRRRYESILAAGKKPVIVNAGGSFTGPLQVPAPAFFVTKFDKDGNEQ